MNWLRRYFAPNPPAPHQPDLLRKQLDAFAQMQVDGDKPIVPPQRIEGMELPEQEEGKKGCTHQWGSKGDALVRGQKPARQNVVPMKWGSR